MLFGEKDESSNVAKAGIYGQLDKTICLTVTCSFLGNMDRRVGWRRLAVEWIGTPRLEPLNKTSRCDPRTRGNTVCFNPMRVYFVHNTRGNIAQMNIDYIIG